MISGDDILKDVMDGGYYSIEEELTICSPIYTGGIKYTNSDKSVKLNVSRPIGRLESLDVYSRLAPDGQVPPSLHFYHSAEPLTDSCPFLLLGSMGIGANIYGRLSLVEPVMRTFTLYWRPNGSPLLRISPHGSEGMAWISIYPESIFED